MVIKSGKQQQSIVLPIDLVLRIKHAQIDSKQKNISAWIEAAIKERLEREAPTT